MTSKITFHVRPDGQGPFLAELEITTEFLDVTPALGGSCPDLAWEFVDEAGHYHAWAKDETLPTLLPRVIRHECFDSACDGVDQVSHVCAICLEKVEPAYRTSGPIPKTIPGRSSWECSIYGVHLEMSSRVSLSFSEPATGKVRYFGIGSVTGNGIQNHGGGATYVTKLYGDGPLARKGK